MSKEKIIISNKIKNLFENFKFKILFEEIIFK